MIIILLSLLAAGGIYLYGMGTGNSDNRGADTLPAASRPLPDINPDEQGGDYLRDYDDAFYRSGEKWGVPFALLKAHAIRESALDNKAYRAEPAYGSRPPSASFGLMQILWWKGSNRFEKYGYNDDLVRDGSPLYDPYVNTTIAAQLIRDNLKSFGNLRDAINAYNTGVRENTRRAPNGYVDDVLKIYSELINGTVA